MHTLVKLWFIGVLLFGSFSVALAQSEKSYTGNCSKTNKRSSTRTDKNIRTMLEIFHKIEQRDEQEVSELFDPNFEIHWPSALPYGGTKRGLKPEGTTWSATWLPLQPTDAERSMDPRVVAACGDDVVILWRQRGVSPAGDRFDGEVLALYQLRKHKLVRAQMFYFDTAAVASFLAKAQAQSQRTRRARHGTE